MIGLFHDKDDYKNEFKLFKDAVQGLAHRIELKAGIVIDPKLVEVVKEE